MNKDKLESKFETIYNNDMNGNMFDYRKGLKGLTKPQLLDYIFYAMDENTEDAMTVYDLIHSIKRNLEL